MIIKNTQNPKDMLPTGKVSCPKCNEEMNLRVGRGWNNKVYFYCKCGEILEI